VSYITAKEVAEVRKNLKAEFPEFKFSVRTIRNNTVDVAILRGTEDFKEFLSGFTHRDVNHYYLDRYGKYEELFTKITRIMRGKNWYDNTDISTDYFDQSHYISLSVGDWSKPYECVK